MLCTIFTTTTKSPQQRRTELRKKHQGSRMSDHQHHGLHSGDHQCSCSSSSSVTASQSLDELEFERGIWTAAIDNDERKLRALIDRGHLQDRDNSGYTALHYAARNGHLSICRILLDSGIDVNACTHGESTALHRAAMMGHVHIVDHLLTRKAMITLQDADGKTALHRAAEKGSYEVCRSLLQHDPSLATICDRKGKFPLELANQQSANYHQLVELFQSFKNKND